jgi:hypothetical protein
LSLLQPSTTFVMRGGGGEEFKPISGSCESSMQHSGFRPCTPELAGKVAVSESAMTVSRQSSLRREGPLQSDAACPKKDVPLLRAGYTALLAKGPRRATCMRGRHIRAAISCATPAYRARVCRGDLRQGTSMRIHQGLQTLYSSTQHLLAQRSLRTSLSAARNLLARSETRARITAARGGSEQQELSMQPPVTCTQSSCTSKIGPSSRHSAARESSTSQGFQSRPTAARSLPVRQGPPMQLLAARGRFARHGLQARLPREQSV